MNGKKRIFVILAFLILSFLLVIYGASRNQARFTVTFMDGYNDKVIDKQIITSGDDVEVPEAPKHDSFVFGGWYLYGSKDSLVTKFKSVEKDLKVEARYKADRNKNGIADDVDTYYTVRFIDGVTSIILKTESVLVGMGATAPMANVHANYTFAGWNREYSNIQNNLDVLSIYTRENILTMYTLNFYNKEGKIFTTQNIANGNASASIEVPEYEGYTFEGWYLDSNHTEKYELGSIVSGNLNIYGNWIINNYEVKINTNGGTATGGDGPAETEINANHGEKIMLPGASRSYKLTYDGNEKGMVSSPVTRDALFLGWCKGSATCDASELIKPFTEVEVTENTEFFAIWGKSESVVNLTDAVSFISKELTYSFAGWATCPNCDKTYNYDEEIYLDKDLTLYAVWNASPRKYNLTFNLKGGSFEGPVITEYDYGTTIEGLPTPDKNYILTYDANGGTLSNENYQSEYRAQFLGWCEGTTDTCTEFVTSVLINENKIYTAKWGKSEKINLINATKESTSTKNYEFRGWVFENALFTDEIELTQNTTLVADYIENIRLYEVCFDSNYDKTNLPAKQNVEYESKVTPVSNLTSTEHEFQGWYNSETAWNFETNKVTENITLNALWKNNLVFDTKGGTITGTNPEGLVDENKEIVLPEVTKNYTITYNTKGGNAVNNETGIIDFLGWCKDTETCDPKLPTSTLETITRNTKYTAVWAEKLVSLPVTTKEETAQYSYEFLGWSTTDSNNVTYPVNSNISVTGNITLYAVWGETVRTYKVDFIDYNNQILKTEYVQYGSSATAPTVPEYMTVDKVYTFTGWDKSFSSIIESTTIKALYSVTDRKYIVTFINGETPFDMQEVVYNGSATKPFIDPIKENWTFTGWDKSFNQITGDLNVYAVFTPDIKEIVLTSNSELKYQVNSNINIKDNLVVTKVYKDSSVSSIIANSNEYTVNDFDINTVTLPTRNLSVTINNLISNTLPYKVYLDTKFEVKFNETYNYTSKERVCVNWFIICLEYGDETKTKTTNFKFLEVTERYDELVQINRIKANYTDNSSNVLQISPIAYYENYIESTDNYHEPMRIARKNNNKDVMTDTLIINTLEIKYIREGIGEFEIIFKYNPTTKEFTAISETQL